MAVRDEYIELATKDVDMISLLKYIEQDLKINLNILEGNTAHLRCPAEVLDLEDNVHESDSNTKTSVDLSKNTLKCWNPACPCSKNLNTIHVARMFYEDLSFEQAVELVLNIGGFDYESEKTELTEEQKLSLLLTNYVTEKCENLMKGYDLIESGAKTTNRYELLYIDAAKYLLSRGIDKYVAKKMRLGVGGGFSNVLKNNSKDILTKAKILSSKKQFEIMSKRIIIPNISHGFVIGMTGRAIYDNNRRYLNVGLVKNLINIDKAKKYDTIFLFEGALNAASYMVLTGEENAMAMQGAESFKIDFLTEIVKEKAMFNENTEFVYVSDNDVAGLKAAQSLGMDILRLGFSLNVLVTPQSKSGKKIDTNDILMNFGKEKGLKVWNEFTKTAEPFIVFAIKQEISTMKGLNPLTLEMKKCQILRKYLTLDFIDPHERWILEQYFLQHGYPVTPEFFKYADIHFVKEPVLSGENLICFVGNIDAELQANLDENEKPYNIIDIHSKVNIYDMDASVNVILITNSLYLFRTKKIAQKLIQNGNTVKIYYTDKKIKSILEYTFAISKAVEAREFFNNLGK